jgi:hypothetical protein
MHTKAKAYARLLTLRNWRDRDRYGGVVEIPTRTALAIAARSKLLKDE